MADKNFTEELGLRHLDKQKRVSREKYRCAPYLMKFPRWLLLTSASDIGNMNLKEVILERIWTYKDLKLEFKYQKASYRILFVFYTYVLELPT